MDTGRPSGSGVPEQDFTGAHEVLAALRSLDPGVAEKAALASSVSTFEQQLRDLESLRHAQALLAREYGLSAALPPGCASTSDAQAKAAAAAGELLSPGHGHGQGQDANGGAVSMDIFSFADGLLEREHVVALAWQSNCPQETVRRELRAFQKAVSDRLALATRRAKLPYKPPPSPAAAAAVAAAGGPKLALAASGVVRRAATSPVPLPAGVSGGGGGISTSGSGQGPAGTGGLTGEAAAYVYCLDEAEEAVRQEKMSKLAPLLRPDTGGIAGSPVHVVGCFQQLMAGCSDWRVRAALLAAMGRSALDVLWRLVQNSRVLDCLHLWLQDALSDGQVSMGRLMLDTMARLPMRRDLLKGSRLEASLEALADGDGGGGDATSDDAVAAAAAANDGSMRRRFGEAAAAVLEEWRRDPDPVTIMQRAGAPVTDALLNGRAAAAAAAALAAAPLPKGSKLLGPGAAAAAARKRALPSMPSPAAAAAAASSGRVISPAGQQQQQQHQAQQQQHQHQAQQQGDIRGAPRPRLAEAGEGGPGGGGGGGGGGAVRRLAPAAQPAVTDMTAKLGEKGPTDTDVVPGFRSRLGDGAVRRSQLAARTQRAGPAAAATAGGGGGPPPPSAVTVGGARGGAGPRPGPGPGPVGGADGEVELELDAEAVARLRAQRAAQRHASSLAALQAEARRLPQVAAAEQQARQRQDAYAAARAHAARQEQLQRQPDAVAAALEGMRETVPWVGPPPPLRLPPDAAPLATHAGEESKERHARAGARLAAPKVTYPSPDLAPDWPAEPPEDPAPQQQQQAAAAAAAGTAAAQSTRAIPWCPSPDAEDGHLDWWRQNLVLWEKGVRLADYALPPAVLHRHLELDPSLLPPKYAAGPPPPSAAAAAPPRPAARGLPPPPPHVSGAREPLLRPPPAPLAAGSLGGRAPVGPPAAAAPQALGLLVPVQVPAAVLAPPPGPQNGATLPPPPPPAPLRPAVQPPLHHHDVRRAQGLAPMPMAPAQGPPQQLYGESYDTAGGSVPYLDAYPPHGHGLEPQRHHYEPQPHLGDRGRPQPERPRFHSGRDPEPRGGPRYVALERERSPPNHVDRYPVPDNWAGGPGGYYPAHEQRGGSPPLRGHRGRR